MYWLCSPDSMVFTVGVTGFGFSVICLSARREDVIAAWGCVIGAAQPPTPGFHGCLAQRNVSYMRVHASQGREIRKRLKWCFSPPWFLKGHHPYRGRWVCARGWGSVTPVFGPQVKELNRPAGLQPELGTARLLQNLARKVKSVRPLWTLV